MEEESLSTLLMLAAIGVSMVLTVRMFKTLKARETGIRPLALKAMLDQGDDLLLLDVRTPGEFASARIPGAVNVPLAELVSRMQAAGADLEGYRETPVVVVCHSDKRAATAVLQMQKAGFANARVLIGGMAAWQAAGLPAQNG